MKEVVLTREGYERLREEIDRLRGEKRSELAERLRIAREFGDIAENGNSEYDHVKDEQALLEARIARLEERLHSACVIDEREISTEAVSIGTVVRLKNLSTKSTHEYRIVGSGESDPDRNRLSNESPIGKAILGKSKGETVEVSAPGGTFTLKILEIA